MSSVHVMEPHSQETRAVERTHAEVIAAVFPGGATAQGDVLTVSCWRLDDEFTLSMRVDRPFGGIRFTVSDRKVIGALEVVRHHQGNITVIERFGVEFDDESKLLFAVASSPQPARTAQALRDCCLVLVSMSEAFGGVLHLREMSGEEIAVQLRSRVFAIERILIDTWHLWCPTAQIDQPQRKQVERLARRVVAMTAPGVEMSAEYHAVEALKDLVAEAARDASAPYQHDTFTTVIEQALERMGTTIARGGVPSILTAYRGRLDGGAR